MKEKEKEQYYENLSNELNILGETSPKEAAKKAKNIVEEARKKGDTGYAFFFEGEEKVFKNELKEAEELEKKAIELHPKVAFIISNYASVLTHLGRNEEAIQYYDRALEINPKSDYALGGKGTSLAELGHHEEAIHNYDRALEINPKSDYDLCGKGASLAELGHHEEAIQYYDRTLEINPLSDYALSLKGASLAELGHREEAIQYFNRVLEINPKSDDALSNKGALLSQLGREEEAIQYFDRALEINPKSEHALTQKGVSLSELGREGEAIQYFDRVLELNPKSEHALRNKGASLSLMGKYKKSIKCYEESKKIKPWDEIDLSFLIRIYDELGQPEEAIKVAKKLKKVLKRKSQPTDYVDFELFQLESKSEVRKKVEGAKFEDCIQKVLRQFDPKRMNEWLRDINEYAQKQKEILGKKDYSKKVKRSDKCGFLCVLRQWNSYTPLMHSYESKGGGYYLYLNGKGMVIDPGFDFVRNFLNMEFNLWDIDYIFITHAHIDHMADLESLFMLMHEANNERKNEDKKKVTLFLNLGCIKKIAGWVDLRDENIELFRVLERGNKVELSKNFHVIPTYAKHNEIIDDEYCLGYIFGNDKIKIGFTGDTRWTLDGSIGKQYKGCDVLVAHLGSIYKDELNLRGPFEKRLDDKHLGLLGLSGMIDTVKPRLCVISEFGEELKNLRADIADGLTKALRVKCIAADLGTEVIFDDDLTIRSPV